jgi:hypothetical protein
MLRFEIFTEVTMNNAVFWNMTPVVLVTADISEACIAPIFRVTGIDELGTTLA